VNDFPYQKQPIAKKKKGKNKWISNSSLVNSASKSRISQWAEEENNRTTRSRIEIELKKVEQK